MKAITPIIWVVSLATLLSGCASSSQAEKEQAAQAAEQRLEQVSKERESLLGVIRTLKPEAFEDVGLYRIKPGDTGAKIARAHDLDMTALQSLNPDVNWTRLKVWQVIRIRADAEEKEPNKALEPTATVPSVSTNK
jgi:LysM repeat protein